MLDDRGSSPRARGTPTPKRIFQGRLSSSRLDVRPSGKHTYGCRHSTTSRRPTRPAASVGGSSHSLSLRDSISLRGRAVSFSATDDSLQESFRPTEHGIMLLGLESFQLRRDGAGGRLEDASGEVM